MAKTEKVKPGADFGGVSERTLKKFLTDAANFKGAKDSAAMEYAGHFKAADEKGIHGKAIKQVMSLQNMSPADRSAWLRAFDRYRDVFDLDAQAELELSQEGDDVVDPPKRRNGNGEARAEA